MRPCDSGWVWVQSMRHEGWRGWGLGERGVLGRSLQGLQAHGMRPIFAEPQIVQQAHACRLTSPLRYVHRLNFASCTLPGKVPVCGLSGRRLQGGDDLVRFAQRSNTQIVSASNKARHALLLGRAHPNETT